MKKTIILAVAVAALGFTACKKDRTCTCNETSTSTTTTTMGGSSSTTTNSGSSTDVKVMTKIKKGAAKANCLSYKTDDTQTNSFGGATQTTETTTTGSCTLK